MLQRVSGESALVCFMFVCWLVVVVLVLSAGSGITNECEKMGRPAHPLKFSILYKFRRFLFRAGIFLSVTRGMARQNCFNDTIETFESFNDTVETFESINDTVETFESINDTVETFLKVSTTRLKLLKVSTTRLKLLLGRLCLLGT